MANNRIALYLPDTTNDRLREIAAARGWEISDTLRVAIGLLDVAERARVRGEYMGTTPIREDLRTVMVMPL
jgi:hypothetical protein